MRDPEDVEYWRKERGVSKERLQRPVDAVGNSSLAVRRHIGWRTPTAKSASALAGCAKPIPIALGMKS